MRLALLFLLTLVLLACEAPPPAASAPTPTNIPTEQSVEPPVPTITPTPTKVPEPTSTAVSTPTPEPTATFVPTPTRTTRSLLPVFGGLTPIPDLSANWTPTPSPTPYLPEGLDVHGYEQFIYRFEALGFVFEVSTKDELKQVTGTKDDMTLTLLGPNDGLHSIKLSWDNGMGTPISELELLTIHVNPRGETWCIIDALNESPPSLVIRGDNLYAAAATEDDGQTSLTYTSWEHMPAFFPNNLPSTC